MLSSVGDQAAQSQALPSSSTDPGGDPHASESLISDSFQKPRKKALLIGVQGDYASTESDDVPDCDEADERFRPRAAGDSNEDVSKLKGPHNDVRDLKALIMEIYEFAEEDTTVLIDNGKDDQLQPTQDNILRAIADLVADARPGDRFLFVFAGHSLQRPAKEEDNEEDGLNEYITTSDGKSIMDNILYEMLVVPLPAMCKLTAIFDCCHSGTLLDLKHHRCNRVFLPWISKGKRRTKTMWYMTVKKQAILIPEERRKTSRSSFRATITSVHRNSAATIVPSRPGSGIKPKVPREVSISTQKLSITTSGPMMAEAEGSNVHVAFVESPVTMSSPVRRFCDGNCRNYRCSQDESTPRADVICLSSSQDSEKTWEDPEGKSMIQSLIELLRENPNPLLHDLMTDISHNIHRAYLDLHLRSRTFRKKMAEYLEKKRAKQLKKGKDNAETTREGARTSTKRKLSDFEMTNFQTPELSSLAPLDMKRRRLSF